MSLRIGLVGLGTIARAQHLPAIAATPRFADAAECGELIAFLSGAHVGFMTGQNIVIDGGVYQGLF